MAGNHRKHEQTIRYNYIYNNTRETPRAVILYKSRGHSRTCSRRAVKRDLHAPHANRSRLESFRKDDGAYSRIGAFTVFTGDDTSIIFVYVFILLKIDEMSCKPIVRYFLTLT